jgi:hypothetical protein
MGTVVLEYPRRKRQKRNAFFENTKFTVRQMVEGVDQQR